MAKTKQNEVISFLKDKKEEMKDNKYRKRFDAIAQDIDNNLIDTTIQRNRIDQSIKTLIYMPTIRPDGSTDYAVLPRINESNDDNSMVPRSAEPISFSKILTAASVICSNTPDGIAYSVNKVKARAYYELWKRSWNVTEMNGYNTLNTVAQNTLAYGWGAWRVYPKKTVVEKKVKQNDSEIASLKVIFDDLFREPLDVRRTWLGLSYKAYNNDNRPEVLFEIDITKDAYKELKKKLGKRKKDDEGGVSDESQKEDADNIKNKVTITFYEHPITNRYVIASDTIVFYDGEMPNDSVYGSIVITQCFSRDMNDPYGVGLYEMMRGNVTLYNYINSLNAEQVEAEIHPLLFGVNMTGQGDMKYRRSPNKINPLPAGASIEKILTTGNVTLGINFANAQKQDINENTGVNDIVAGSDSGSTLGSTVILKEAALNRLIKPRNSIAQAIENDACIFFSWCEQDQAEPREYIFTSPEEVEVFMQLNPGFNHTASDITFTDEGLPQIKVKSSQFMPVTFDYSEEGIAETDFEDQNVNEFGDPKFSIPKSTMFDSIKRLEAPDKIGYDQVTLKVDTNSMLVPSMEIKKQSTMQLFPIIQNTIQIIFGLARQDPQQAISQLTSLKTFLDIQKENIFDYIPKGQYDMIMSGQMQPTPEQMMQQMMAQAGGEESGSALQSDGTNVAQPQAPNELPQNQSKMGAAMDASIGRAKEQSNG